MQISFLCPLQQVVTRVDQAPFAPHLCQSAVQELAQPAGLYDLPKDRLDQGPAEPVSTLRATQVNLVRIAATLVPATRCLVAPLNL
jgi:hypothetical protein